MKREFLNTLRKFGSSDRKICLSTLGVSPEQIRETVIVSPGWRPDRLFPADSVRTVRESTPLFGYEIREVCTEGKCFTWLRAGFGAPAVMDAVLLLGLTGCRKILFISSVGGLLPEHRIGDLLVPEYSVSGDGAGRYLTDDPFRDRFGEKIYPDGELSARLYAAAEEVCLEGGTACHRGRPFCTDTIVAQYGHLSRIRETGCDCLDMESAALFRAAKLLELPAAALLNVSDNSSAAGSSLMTARTGDEQERRRYVIRELMPRILLRMV